MCCVAKTRVYRLEKKDGVWSLQKEEEIILL